MNKTGKIILISTLTVALCVSIIAGATFALFASEASTNIAISSGKVDVAASVANFHMYTRNENGGRVEDEWLSGSASQQDGEITLSNMAPYDGVTFDINIVSNSTVAIKWQVKLTFEGDSELYQALEVEIGGIDLVDAGSSRASNWSTLAPTEGEQSVAKLSVKIELAEGAKEIQDKNCSITITVFAVQGNANLADDATS